MSEPPLINAAVFGASGFVGGELCRLLLGHRHIRRIFPTSRKTGDCNGRTFERAHQNLLGCGLEFLPHEEILHADKTVDVAFFCTPTGQAMREAGALLERGVRVIDLGADFRFLNIEEFHRAHGVEHSAPELLDEAVCGISELYRDQIKTSRLVANPGCYVIATILGLLPLAEMGLLNGKRLSVCAINGTSGAGAQECRDLHHPNAFASMLPYNLNGHRHRLEIDTRLREQRATDFQVDLSTMHGCFARGLVITASIPLEDSDVLFDRESLAEIYRSRYGEGHDGERFVLINDFPRSYMQLTAKEYDIYPQVARVIGSNYCHIGFDVDTDARAIKVISVIDNLIKGAAGSALQNMNIQFGLREHEGLRAYGM